LPFASSGNASSTFGVNTVSTHQQLFKGLPVTLDDKTLDALGLEMIEGEYPSRSYYTAELRQDVDYANQVAREMGLGFRFRSPEPRVFICRF
jgi:hypothetical protein